MRFIEWIISVFRKHRVSKTSSYPESIQGLNIAFDSEIIWSDLSDGNKSVIAWHELNEIKIVTTDEGPFRDDVFWVLQAEDVCICFPIGVEGEQEFLERVQELVGFDNTALINSMSSAHNQEFKCWHKQA